ncbi:hypothetical protein G9C85_00115 [Halorubellus sp. JP-L1]|uniref:hypothetical protein n=1 Tax=Halorubellus sp. JP-L1 TaxID=2715753 RepID=UPI00140BD8B1|nr:hypothetical protein [Halorubellus sp. JP-L1]NHN40042.1 hypothetical protein [Halorubellus sp. JP-L1]
MTGWDHPESGSRATPRKIVQAVNRKLASVGIEHERNNARSLQWNNPEHRLWVRDKFEENAREIARKQEALLPGFGPQGRGENAREDCGNPHPFVCSDCANTVEFGSTCSMSVCARCGVAWVRDAAIKKSAKVRRVRKEKYKRSPSHVNQFEHHAVISAPLSWYYDLAAAGLTMEEAQEKTREVVKSILEELRCQGVLIRHSFRGSNPDGSIQSEHDDRGAWKQRLNSDRKWVTDVREDLAWKPHYHCIVVGDELKTRDLSADVEEATGWVIHRIEDDDGKSLPNDGAMARALMYSLSHADIEVRENGHNQSKVWEVGAYKGDAIRSSDTFASRDHDLDWSDAVIRKHAPRILGLRSGTTDCGATMPAVSDPDELARKIVDEIWPQDEPVDVETDTVLAHVSEGTIRVSTSSSSGGGYDVTVTDSDGNRLTGAAGSVPDLATDPFDYASSSEDLRSRPLRQDDVVDDEECDGDCDHDHGDDQHDDDDGDETCDGTLVPLEEARERGLLDDDEWLDQAPFAADALAAHREYPDELVPFGTPPGKAIGAA